MATQQWLTEWASAQVYTDNESMSRACFKDVLPAFPGSQVRFGPNADQTEYIVDVQGEETAIVSIARQV